jgi:hypothetical protein
MAGMDENLYKAPDKEGPSLPRTQSDFLDPAQNAIALLRVAAVAALIIIITTVVAIIRAG